MVPREGHHQTPEQQTSTHTHTHSEGVVIENAAYT